MMAWKAAALSALVIIFAGCGGAGAASNSTPTGPTGGTPPTGGGTPPTTNPNVVSIADQAFTPSTLTVPAGTTVTWQWPACDDTGSGYGGYGGCVTHNVTFDDGSNVASAIQSTGSFSRSFSTVGTFKYHCAVHGASVVSGSITVK
jgi:plastocyanin